MEFAPNIAEIEQWLRSKGGAPQPSPLDEIKAAISADRGENNRADAAALMMQGAQQFTQRRPVPLQQPRVVDDSMRAWLLSRQAGKEEQDRSWREGEPARQRDLLGARAGFEAE